MNCIKIIAKAGYNNFRPSETVYEPVPVMCSLDKLERDNGTQSFSVEPMSFVTKTGAYSDLEDIVGDIAGAPTVFLLVGEYGVGKTELVYQIGKYVAEERAPGVDPLLVRLADCHRHPSLSKLRAEGLEPIEMLDLLFGHLSSEASIPPLDIAEAIHAGKLLMLLDGLDELIFDSKAHENFIRSFLDAIFVTGAGNSRARILLSMRLEYFDSFDDAENPVIAAKTGPERPLNLYFLRLNLFEEQWIEDYLRNHLILDGLKAGHSEVEELLTNLRHHRQMIETLQRPLLLRIFTELLNKMPNPLSRIYGYVNAWIIIREYVDRALQDAYNMQEQERIATLRWNEPAFPAKCLEIYRAGRDSFLIEEDINVLVEGAAPQTPEAALEFIHKCPLFQRSGRDALRFSHRAFFEYYTVQGMVQELTEIGSREGHGSAFDELVLNVDMRKFLRAAIEERAKKKQLAIGAAAPPDRDYSDAWYEETRRSYGLATGDECHWTITGPLGLHGLYADLEKTRCILLDVMTDPRQSLKDEELESRARAAVEWFMNHEDIGLHPGYLRFNYEAVTVFLRERRWDMGYRPMSKLFEEIVHNRLRLVCMALNDTLIAAWLQRELELLYERILSIGLRLRCQWIEDLNVSDNIGFIRNNATRARIEILATEIGRAACKRTTYRN